MIGYLLKGDLDRAVRALRDAYNAASTADHADQLAGRYEEPMQVGPVRYPVSLD